MSIYKGDGTPELALDATRHLAVGDRCVQQTPYVSVQLAPCFAS